jgi:hypothetical protein
VDTKEYAYVGRGSQVGDLEFTSPGQRAKFTDAQLADCLLGGAMFVPVEIFEDKFSGIDAEELARYSDPYFFGEPSEEYSLRLEECRELARMALKSLAKN